MSEKELEQHEFYCETHDDIGCIGVMCHIDVEVYPSLDCIQCELAIDIPSVCMDCEVYQKENEDERIIMKNAWEQYIKEDTNE